jgi:phosphopantothenoylcysteine decarboxylase/phosphopantothenate--cysteine ligase
MQIELERTQDILAAVAALDTPPFTLGFAAETQAVEQYAREKLQRKKLNMIAANQVGIAGQGFDSTDNALHILWATGEQKLPLANKLDLARQLIVLMADLFYSKEIF